MIMRVGDVVWDVSWDRGNSAGWSDDLGIIADTNQWVQERPAGWYARRYVGNGWWVSVRGDQDLRDWCQQNLSSHWEIPPDGYLYMSSEEDVTLFKIAWT